VPVNGGALHESIRQLEEAVPDESDLGATVQSVVEVVRGLCHGAGTGLLLLDGGHVLRYVAASDDETGSLLASEEQAREGPGHEAVATGDVARSPEVGRDARWPRLQGVTGASPLGPALAAPVRVGGTPVGSLVLRIAGGGGDDVEAARGFARVVEVVLAPALLAHRRDAVVAQLQHALDTRVVVERAVGFLMASGEGDARRAFERLRRAARRRRRPVVELATGLLRGEPIELD
jgi:hypothetical protein